MNELAIILGVLAAFIAGMTAGMNRADSRILEMTEAMEDLLNATTEYVAAMREAYKIAQEATSHEGGITDDR